MAVPTRSSIRKSMERKRAKFLKEAKTPCEVKFGNDRDALNFACWDYYYQYYAWHGNFLHLSEVTYDDFYGLFTTKIAYDDLMDSLKEDYSATKDKETKTLIDLARVLRRRYGGK